MQDIMGTVHNLKYSLKRQISINLQQKRRLSRWDFTLWLMGWKIKISPFHFRSSVLFFLFLFCLQLPVLLSHASCRDNDFEVWLVLQRSVLTRSQTAALIPGPPSSIGARGKIQGLWDGFRMEKNRRAGMQNFYFPIEKNRKNDALLTQHTHSQ